jgi:hypothetical protein
VVRTSDERGRKVMGDIYRPLSLKQAPLMFTERRTAEMIRYAANAFLATKITFINEIADLSEKAGANVQGIARGIWPGQPHRHQVPVYRSRLDGSCFPKDTKALIKIAQDYDVSLRIVESALAVNENRKRAMARKVSQALGAARQDHRGTRPHLQAQHRRHARCAVAAFDFVLKCFCPFFSRLAHRANTGSGVGKHLVADALVHLNDKVVRQVFKRHP